MALPDLHAHSDRPDLFQFEWRFLSDQLALVSRFPAKIGRHDSSPQYGRRVILLAGGVVKRPEADI